MNITTDEKYMLVEFVDDVGEQRSIDFVPASWILFDEEKQHLVTPFISTFSKANFQILAGLVKSESEPLQSWPVHRISIRGYAHSYVEAEKKVKALECKANVFSTDNEEHVTAKQNEIIKKYKLKGKKYDEQEVQALFTAAAVDVGNHMKQIQNISTAKNPTKKPSVAKKKKPTVMCRKVYVSPRLTKKNEQGYKRRSSRNLHKKSLQPETEESDSQDTASEQFENSNGESNGCYESFDSSLLEKDKNENVDPENYTARFDTNNNGTPSSTPAFSYHTQTTKKDTVMQISDRRKSEDIISCKVNEGDKNRSSTVLGVDDAGDVKSLLLKCYRCLSAQIGQVQSQLLDLKLCQIEATSMANVKTAQGIDSTLEKHDVGTLPFTTLKELMEFDKKLEKDNFLKRDIINSMLGLIHRDPKKLAKSIRDVVKKFMKRDVLMNFTAVKKTGDKIVFKDNTSLYICIRDAVLAEFSDKPGDSIKEKEITDALGAIIDNAKDWGGREDRRRKI